MADRSFVPTRQVPPVSGARILGLRLHSEFQVVEQINSGFAPGTVGRLARELGLSDKRVLHLTRIPESTYHDRKRRRKALSPEASSRVYSIAKTAEAAESYFAGDKAAAGRWLDSPKVALGGKTPLEFARTPEGSDYVIRLLGRMEHGVVT